MSMPPSSCQPLNRPMSACTVCGRPTVEEDGRRIIHRCAMSLLHQAASSADTHKLRSLLRAGADVNEKDAINGYTAIMFATLGKRLDAIKILVQFHADVNLLSNHGESCLHLAAENGSPDLVKFLLKHGAANTMNTPDFLGHTPLHTASIYGSEYINRLLLDAGANPGMLDKKGRTPLSEASIRGESGIVRLLLGRGVEVDSCDKGGVTPLYWASFLGHLGEVRMLIRAGANVNHYCKTQMFPLYVAAQAGHCDVIKALLKAGADANQIGKDGDTALSRAQSLPCVRLLLAAGANANATDGAGYNALHYAGGRGCSAGVLCSLFKAGCSVTAVNSDGNTPADVARETGKEDAAALLDRLAEEARINSSKSSIHDSACKVVFGENTEGKGFPNEPASIEKDGAVDTRKTVIPCAHGSISSTTYNKDKEHASCHSKSDDDVHIHTGEGRGRPGSVHGDPCGVCLDAEAYKDDPILFCDGCNSAVHISCYGITEIPSGDWFCDGCLEARNRAGQKSGCDLCRNGGGVLKYSADGPPHLSHLICALWTPELGVDDVTKVCFERGGAVVLCNDRRCLASVHPQCGKDIGGYTLIPEDHILYCSRHNPLKHQRREAGKYTSPLISPHDTCTDTRLGSRQESCKNATDADGGHGSSAGFSPNAPADIACEQGKEGAAALLERLAEEARIKSSNELETGGKEDAGGSHKKVKPCAQCGVITHRRCGGCKITHYCSRDCQRAAYKQHKKECADICEKKAEAKAQRAAARANQPADVASVQDGRTEPTPPTCPVSVDAAISAQTHVEGQPVLEQTVVHPIRYQAINVQVPRRNITCQRSV